MEDNNYYSLLYDFIEQYLPNYYSRDDVLRSDILFRFLTNEEINDDDKIWIKNEFNNKLDLIKAECLNLDKKFIFEALENFYKTISIK